MSAREALPNRRYCETFKLHHGEQRGTFHITTGRYLDGRIGEIFIATNKTGSTIEAMARDLAVLMSLLVQHGCTIETIKHALTREQNGAPSTVAGAVADRLAEQKS